MQLRKQIGQLMIVGVNGIELGSVEKSWLTLIEPSGIILFRRNIESPDQTLRLLSEANSTFRCVDLEGGLVDRLRDVVAPMPSPAAVAATGKLSNYKKHGKLIGRAASMLGFNVVLAPVLDLALPSSRSVMRTRTYFEKPNGVVNYAKAFLVGTATEKVLGCGKHFPGLGAGTIDSHHATPVIKCTWSELWSNDLIPYRTLRSDLPMVMVSHASYPNAGDDRPASVSRYWIDEVLTKRLKYRGLILSDDLEMDGVLRQLSIEEAAVQAIAAGTHLIEVCKDPSLILRAYEALLSEAEKSKAFRRMVDSAARKVAHVAKTLPKPATKAPSARQIETIRSAIIRFSQICPEPQSQVIS